LPTASPNQFFERNVYDRGMGCAAAPDVTAFILAGGKSTRMGRDKALVELEGQTLLARTLDLARSVALDVRIVGDGKKFVSFAPVVEDIFRDRGPLGGIHAALRASHTDLNLMLAVDMPFVSAAFLKYLTRQARSALEVAVVVPRTGERWQPLCAVYRPEFAEAAETALLAGQNKIDLLFAARKTRVIGEDELKRGGFSPEIFRNVNTPKELEAGQRSS
jgi:molybdopterin-guanine dinucleotide biosynthesis protein A